MFFWVLQIDPVCDANLPRRIRAFKILQGHNAAVQSVAAQTSGDMVLDLSVFLCCYSCILSI